MRFVGLVLLAGLGGCASTVTPPPSAAILQARAAAAEYAKHGHDPAPCVDPRTLTAEDATTIRFQFMSAEFDVLGARALDRAAAFARCAPATSIVLVAEADGRANAQAQAALAAQRIAAMREGLTKAGVAEGRISTAASKAAAPAGPLVLLGRNLGG